MQTIRVVPYRFWQHKDGRKASVFGACPWRNEASKPDWELVTKGYTWELTDYRGSVTYGLSRGACDTKEAALRVAHEFTAACGGKVIN